MSLKKEIAGGVDLLAQAMKRVFYETVGGEADQGRREDTGTPQPRDVVADDALTDR